jgi:hypothetical protein
MLHIAVINESKTTADSVITEMLTALAIQWNRDLDPVWGVGQASFKFVPKQTTPAAGTWWVVFLDNSKQADALAYHDLTNEGLPISKVFVDSSKADNSSLSVGASHEICEMAVDPWLNGAYQDAHSAFWAGEVCDPVEDDQYAYKIGTTLVTDFVTPAWFGYAHAAGNVDFKQHAKSAFEVLAGGYAQKYDSKKGWQQVTGTKALQTSRGAHAATGSRRERRAREWKNWRRSDKQWSR